MPKFTGHCACGNLSYESDAEPLRMLNCHCRDCQRASGSAFAPLLAFARDRITFSGALSHFADKSERGTIMQRGFCSTCGSPMTLEPAGRPDVLLVLASSLDDPGLHKPSADIWVRSAQPWDHLNPAIPRYETRHPNIFG